MHPEIESELLPTRKTLLDRLKDLDNQASWKEFFDTYWCLIYSTALRSGLSDTEAQEVVQETVITGCRNIGKLNYDPKLGSFKTWLLNLTRWRIVDQLRKRQPAVVGGPTLPDTRGTSFLDQIPDPASASLDQYWDQEWEKTALDTAIQQVKAEVDPKHYQVFDLYTLQDIPAAEVARMMGIAVAQVYLIKHRVARAIKQHVRKLRVGVFPQPS